MRLFIAEKPDMGRQIASALNGSHKNGDGFIETSEGTVTWCVGHIMRMLEPDEYKEEWKKWDWTSLPMIPTEWKIKVEETKAKQFKVVKELIKQASEIVNAGDPGREGQLIVDEVLDYLGNRKPVKRILLQSLDKKTVRNALNNLEDNTKYFNLFQAGQARGYADWLIGMNGTRAFTLVGQKKGYKGVLSVGRVQSPTLAIVVKRDEEIENFIPKDYWVVSGLFDKNAKGFRAYWKPQDGKTPDNVIDDEKRIIDFNYAQGVSNKIKGKQGKVTNYEEKDGREAPPLPFNLSQLQAYANSKWSYTAKEVLDICQSLYEKHYQSYPRTDCNFLPEIKHSEGPTIAKNLAEVMPDLQTVVDNADFNIKTKAWDDSKLSDHYGIIPTEEKADMSKLNEKEKKIYKAVCERFLAQYYPDCEYKTANVEIICESELFKASGKVIKVPGWKFVFSHQVEEEEAGDEEEQVFPDIKVGELLPCSDSKLQAKKTTPPKRFTDGTLLMAMSNVHTLVSDPEMKKKLRQVEGIGREATRAQIIETLIARKLLRREGKFLISTDAGRSLVKALPKKIVDPIVTAMWEQALDQIKDGKITLKLFLEKQVTWVNDIVDMAKTTDIGEIKSAGGSSGQNKSYSKTSSKPSSSGSKSNSTKSVGTGKEKTCPQCKSGKMILRTSKNGKKFYGCSGFPNCKNVEWINEK